MRRSHALLLAAALLAAVGCSSEAQLPAVSGAATVGDAPLPSGTITFYPDAAKGNASAHRPTGIVENGRYELFVAPGKKGAPAGWYKVVVYAVDDPQPGRPNKYFAHKDYADAKTTPLSAEVVSAPEPGRYDLKLKK
jgi:hypothetical protein